MGSGRTETSIFTALRLQVVMLGDVEVVLGDQGLVQMPFVVKFLKSCYYIDSLRDDVLTS